MKEKYKIGELAKLYNISTDTLRLYDKLNLLKPFQNNQNNYRYYDVNSMFKLRRILFLKNLGISLKEIDDYMSNKNTDRLSDMLGKKNDEIDLRIQQLSNLKHKIQSKLQLFDLAKSNHNLIMIKSLPERTGVYLDQFGLKEFQDVKNVFKAKSYYLEISQSLAEGQVYTSIPKSDMMNGIFNRFKYFIEIDTSFNEIIPPLVTLPKQDYATMIVFGPYEDLVKHYKTLVDWIRENHYQITSDSIENNIVDNDYSDSSDEFITEIEIPIKKI